MPPKIVTVLLWLGASVVLGLREIQLSVPEAVGMGASATLGCRWSLDTGETLYTVKWYHGAQEFFRFVPKELPNTRVFSQTGINVDVSRSGGQQVVLRGATKALSGRYKCEVSADAPFFHTVYKSAYMRVVELPEFPPRVVSPKSWYSSGDLLRANCSSPPGDPPANLTWLVNGQEVKGLDIPPRPAEAPRSKPMTTNSSYTDANRIIFTPWEAAADDVIDIPSGTYFPKKEHTDLSKTDTYIPRKLERYQSTESPEQVASKLNTNEESSNKLSSFSQLVMRVQSVHFRKGRLNVTCVARVFAAWSASAELLLDEERPQIAPVMGSRDSNTGSQFSTSHIIYLALLLGLLFRNRCNMSASPYLSVYNLLLHFLVGLPDDSH